MAAALALRRGELPVLTIVAIRDRDGQQLLAPKRLYRLSSPDVLPSTSAQQFAMAYVC